MSDDTPTQRFPEPNGTSPTTPVPPTPPAGPTSPTAPVGNDAPTQRFEPPAPPTTPGATGTGDEPPKKSKALLITLISIGAALLIAIILLLIWLFASGQPTPSHTTASPSITPSETPTETPSASASPSEPPAAAGPAIANYSAAPTTVDCTGVTSVPVHFAWQATGTTLWFGVGTDDASAEPFGTFPLNNEMDFNYQCGQTDAQQRYTITVQGENGEKISQTIVIRETD